MRRNFIFVLLAGLVGLGVFASLLSRRSVLPATSEDGQNQPGLIFHGSRDKKVIALTFDADMTPGMEWMLKHKLVNSFYNHNVITILEETKTPATLFLAGMWIETYPQVVRVLAQNPLFELANHSYSHPAFQAKCYALPFIPDSRDEEEIQKTQKLLKQFTGKDNTLFRFPGGCYDKFDLDTANRLGVTVIQWDVVSGDSFNYNTQSIINNVLSRTRNGSIIVMHMHDSSNAPKTADALPTIISELKNKGYTFVKVSELISGLQ